MLDLLNRYAHGYVAVPVIVALRRRSAFRHLAAGCSEATLAAATGANTGHLAAAVRLLDSLGWVERSAGGRLTLAVAGGADPAVAVPEALADAYAFDWSGWLDGNPADGGPLGRWLPAIAGRWGAADAELADMLDGVLVLPVLNGLNRRGQLAEAALAAGLPGIADPARAAIAALFTARGWAEADGAGLRLSDAGRFAVERGPITGTTASYGPMLRRMDDLLFGDCAAVFARDGLGRERHLDRTLNVVASGFQHQKYFADLDDAVIAVFDRLPVEEQPRAVVDMGCGDGSLLKRIWHTVAERSARGRALDRHPLTLVGVDFNEASLEATRKTLDGLPHRTLPGDIADPARLMRDLEALGFGDADAVLHVRSFLDHDRPWGAPRDAAAAARRGEAGNGVDVAPDGRRIDPADAVQSLVEHLGRWAGVVGRHGLLALEVHSLDAAVVRRHRDQTENLHFDAYHAFSGQHLVAADVFLLAAAEAGLFGHAATFRKYPRVFPLARIVLNRFERRPYRVRQAHADDLAALLRLEDACWPEPLRTAADALRARLDRFPDGQCVMELDGRVVGAVYAQRIAAVDRLRTARWDTVGDLHADDGPVVQLLGMNVLPEAQDRGLGDQLLDFALQWYALKGGVEAVAGVTRCRDFADHAGQGMDAQSMDAQGMDAYVRARDEAGRPLDPILRFHAHHGAAILGPVAGYRPEDTANRGFGVLIAYDLQEERTLSASSSGGAAAGDAAAAVDDCVRRVMRARARDGYSRRTALRDLGLDSADLLELRALLARRFGVALEPTFFFAHPTPERIATALGGGAAPRPAAPPVAAPPTPVEAPSAPDPRPAGAVAVIGAGCRFPGGADDPDAFWDLLVRGVDAVGEVPAGRWPHRPDAPRFGGFLDGVELFDAEAFGIAPREARLIDPQQRLLLEVGTEALEHAGLDPDRLRGSRTGVFVGVFSHDYETRILARGDDADLDVHFATGTSTALAAGRLAYVYGLNGPAVTVNTACSSALVAVHQACRSLLDGESELALAGGVNLLLTPELSVVFARAGMLAADGRCRTFDAAAGGYVRSEGCGVVVLKRLDRALADGDRVLAVIRGSAVNQDGASNGLTAPSGPAQEAVIADALAAAGVAAADVGFVEAHGTGTPLGDPVEVKALAAVYGRDRPDDRPLLLGSVKTNIGHAEAAAGVAGLLKAVLAVGRGVVPGSLHFQRPNPHLGLETLPLAVPTAVVAWPAGAGEGAARLAGVSSFGFSGTNAHVIVGAPPAETPPVRRGPRALTLSADGEEALRGLAGRWAAWLDHHPDADPADLCASANAGRRRRPVRAAVTGGDVAELRAGLRALADNAPEARKGGNAPVAHPGDHTPRVAFLFTGQGSQYAGMGQALYDSEPVFRATVDRCDAALRDALGRPLPDLLYGADAGLLDQTAYTQPALFALEVALAALWRSWGVEPVAVLGHSVGEYAAACVAGALSVEDGARLIAARGRLMQDLPAGGAMVAVLAAAERVAAAVRPFADRVAVAAVNGPRNTVVSGAAAAVEAIAARFRDEGVRCVPLTVSHAFHSPLMDPMLPAFRAAAAAVRWTMPRLPLVSNLGGAVAGAEIGDPATWVRHVREPVAFAQGMATLAGLGIDAFLEIGPQPTLVSMGRACVAGAADWLPSLMPGRPDAVVLGEAAAALHRRGADIDWRAAHGTGYRRLPLPATPFQRRRHWVDAAPPGRRGGNAGADDGGHPLIGRRMALPGSPEVRWQARFTAATARFFDEHRLFGRIVVPAASHVSMAFAALAELAPGPHRLCDLVFAEPLALGDGEVRSAQLVLAPETGGGRTVRLLTADAAAEDGAWLTHAQGRVEEGATPPPAIDRAAVEARCRGRMDGAAFYAAFRGAGYTFGPALCWIDDVRLGEDEALCRLVRPDGLDDREDAYAVYPALLDAAFQLQGVWFGADGLAGTDSLFVPFSIEALTLHGAVQPGAPLWSHAVRHPADADSVVADVRLIDAAGAVVVEARRFRFRRVARAALLAGTGGGDRLFAVDWRAAPLPAPTVAVAPRDLAGRLAPRLPALAQEVAAVAGPRLLAGVDDLCVRFIAAAFAAAGRPLAVGERLDADSAAARLSVQDRHRRLLARVLALLAEAGVLDGAGIVRRVPGPAAPLLAELGARHPAAAAELALLGRCGTRLAEVLRGAADPLELLFPGGDDAALLALYRDAPAFRALNALAAGALAGVVAARGSGRPLRVLEVGAGTGATTAALLPVLPAGAADYLFTDLSPRFAARARETFAGYPALRTGVFDLERPAAGQGVEAGGIDVLVAANVLHATRDLAATLATAADVLAPGGTLLLLEAVEPRGWVDLTFGLTEGWWRFADTARRPAHPLLDAAGWRAVLAEAGFDAVEVVEVPAEAPLFRQALFIARRAAPRPGRWLLVGDGRGMADALARRLVPDAERVTAGDLADALCRPGAAWRGVVDLGALDAAGALPEAAAAVAGATLATVRTLARAEGPPPSLWLVSRDAQPVVTGDAVPDPAQAALWGVGRVAKLEHPELGCRLIDLDPGDESADALAALLAAPDGEDQCAVRGGVRLVPRLVGRSAGTAAFAPRADRGYLITGGLGGLGLRLARRLVERGARHLVLMGRSPPGEGQRSEIAALERAGAAVTVQLGDVGRRADVAAALAAADRDAAPLAGVFHAAGVLDDGAILSLDGARLQRVLAAKVGGAWLLHALTVGRSLDAFVLFSSAAGLLGNAGQANHAAANAVLDALAAHRRAQGLAGLSVDWGAWAEVGTVARANPFKGLTPMPPDECLDTLERLMAEDVAQAAVMAPDWPALLARVAPPPFLEEVAPKAAPASTAPAVSGSPARPQGGIAERLAALPAAGRREALARHVAAEVAAVLGLPTDRAVEPREGFFKLGMDSLTSLELRGRLQAGLGTPLPATVAFDHPNVAALTAHLAVVLDLDPPPESTPVPPPAVAAVVEVEAMSDDELVALIDGELDALGLGGEAAR